MNSTSGRSALPDACRCPDVRWSEIAHEAGLCGADSVPLAIMHLRDVHFQRALGKELKLHPSEGRWFLTLREARSTPQEVLVALTTKLDSAMGSNSAMAIEIGRLEGEVRSLTGQVAQADSTIASLQEQLNDANAVRDRLSQSEYELNCVRSSGLYRIMWRIRRMLGRKDSFWPVPARGEKTA